jgi:hypothetical protein
MTLNRPVDDLNFDIEQPCRMELVKSDLIPKNT